LFEFDSRTSDTRRNTTRMLNGDYQQERLG
jgi:hypothetical protein